MPTLDCLLCGVSGPQIRPGVVEWIDRARVEATGERWPIVVTRDENDIEAVRLLATPWL